MVELKYSLTPDDLRRAWRADNSLAPVVDSLSVPFAIFSALVGMFFVQQDRDGAMGWALLILSGCVLVSASITRRRMLARWTDHAVALGFVHLSIDENGLFAKTPNAETRAAWDSYVDTHESPDGFLLYHSKSSYVFIPMRGFSNSADIETFRALAGRKIVGRR